MLEFHAVLLHALLIMDFAFCGPSFVLYEAPKYLPVGTFASLNSTSATIMTATVSAVLPRQGQLHTTVAIVLCVAGYVL